MSHALSRLVAEARRDQFVIPPHGAVEEHQGRARQARFEIVGHPRAGGEEKEIFAARFVEDPKPERIARSFAARRVRLAFEIPRALAGNLEGEDFDAGWRAVGQSGFERRVELDRLPLHVLLVQHIKDAVGLENCKHPLMRIKGEGRALAHRQQARDRVDLAIGQDHACDRAVAKLAWPWDEAAASRSIAGADRGTR